MAGEVGVLGVLGMLGVLELMLLRGGGASCGSTVSRFAMAVANMAKLATTTLPKPPTKNTHITPTRHHGTLGKASLSWLGLGWVLGMGVM